MLPLLLFINSVARLVLSADPQAAATTEVKPVKVSVYYETLCPDSIRFIVSQLYPVFKSDLKNITEIDLVPYGKATQKKVDGKWEFTCQHGPRECEGNIFQTCAVRMYSVDEHVPLIHCMEVKPEPDRAGKQCVEEIKKRGLNLSYDKLDSCTKSTQGNEWQHEMADRTHNLQPPLYFVPWITIDGVHRDDIQRKALSNLQSVICDAYKGKKPTSCGARR